MIRTSRSVRAVVCTWLTVMMLFGSACTVPIVQRKLEPVSAAETLSHQSPFLKAHLKNGELYVLSDWTVDESRHVVTGRGDRLDIHRRSVEKGESLSVPLSDVVLFETNVAQRSKRIQALAIMTGVSVAATAACLTNPKACFGSCPTFYTSYGAEPVLQAEGFSSSILPSLEKRDVDALYRTSPRNSRFELRMTNEAQETHVVRYVRLLAAPRVAGGRVFATSEAAFWHSREVLAPTTCSAPEGDCTVAVRSFDAAERFTPADGRNLGKRETIELRFAAPASRRVGLVIAARQTLLSTFLLYQALAYLGTSTVDRLATIERSDSLLVAGDGPTLAETRAGGMARRLGGIDAYVRDHNRKWVKSGVFQETGPLATDVRLIPLPAATGGEVLVRLDLTKGLWRIDAVLLATLDEKVEPLVVSPSAVRYRGDNIDPSALFAREPLIALPGDEYSFAFELPSDDYELFLDTRGYYLEWIRREWLRDENRMGAAMMLYAPGLALRLLAPQFKRMEAEMESQFWSSRYVAP